MISYAARVEVDETYVGRKIRGMGRRYTGNKTPVVTLVERDGKARSPGYELRYGKQSKACHARKYIPKDNVRKVSHMLGRGLEWRQTHESDS